SFTNFIASSKLLYLPSGLLISKYFIGFLFPDLIAASISCVVIDSTPFGPVNKCAVLGDGAIIITLLPSGIYLLPNDLPVFSWPAMPIILPINFNFNLLINVVFYFL